MQQLTCPNCGGIVTAAHINIQQMTAICPHCSHLFQFEPPQAKAKRRKVKQPEGLALYDGPDALRMDFRTNFRLDRNQLFANAALLAVMMTVLTVIMVTTGAVLEVPLVTLATALTAGAGYYASALIAYNQTELRMDDRRIIVTRGPVPNPLAQPTVVELSDVEAIRYEETAISIREQYDTPRYHVWAERVDGSQERILTDMVDDYAAFISQRLNERLAEDREDYLDTRRLQDSAADDVDARQQSTSQQFRDAHNDG